MNTYTIILSDKQIEKLHQLLVEKSFTLSKIEHSLYKAVHKEKKLNIVVYKSKKCLIQGKGTRDFIEFILEPQILKTFTLNYEFNDFQNKAGMDEAGKGDYFGALCIAAVYLDQETLKKIPSQDIKDSKTISDKKIKVLAPLIRKNCLHNTVVIYPKKYNELYDKFDNLNTLLAWAHATCIEKLVNQNPQIETALLDKFEKTGKVKNILLRKGLKIKLIEQTKAESDIAVACASILARDSFLNSMDILSEKTGITIPKGGGAQTITAGKKLLEIHGNDILTKTAKLHFRNTEKILE